MNDRFNTIAGWVLGGGIVLLGATLVTGEYFKSERPETMGYPIQGVQEEGGGGAEAEQPIAHFLQTADAGRGERVFAKCAACHTINQGGASGVGPNLWATMGAPLAHVAGFSYSEALRGKGGNWTWDAMSEWLRSPRAFAPGTKMTFAGLSDPQDRADLMVYMNAQGSSLPLPAAPAAGPAAPGPAGEAPGNAANASPAVNGAAPDQPVVNEAQAARSPEGRVRGEAAPGAGNNATDR
jgi:cytochrome c